MGRRAVFIVLAAALASASLLLAAATPPALAQDSGYWMLERDGRVHAFGGARHCGDVVVSSPTEAVDIEAFPDGAGYWLLDAAHAVRAMRCDGADGSALGSTDLAGHLRAGERAVSLSALPDGSGYWVFTDRGRVLPFGGAVSHGDMAEVALNGPVLDSVATPSGRGYWMVASDGGIFAFGDARFHGSMGGRPLNRPVMSMAPDPDGDGYWLVASDGGVFAFDAPFHGSMGSVPLNRPVSGMVASPTGGGYLMVAEDGGIFAFGDVPFHGSLGDDPPPSPVVSVAAKPIGGAAGPGPDPRPGGGPDPAPGPGPGSPAPGALDPTYGRGGVLPLPVQGDGHVVDRQRDGRFVVASTVEADGGPSRLAMARFHADGTRDTGYGRGGTGTGPTMYPTGIEIDPGSGAAYVFGAVHSWPVPACEADPTIDPTCEGEPSGHASAVARFRADGTLDTGYGDGGVVLLEQPWTYEIWSATDLEVLPDGEVVVSRWIDRIDGAVSRIDRTGRVVAEGRVELPDRDGVPLAIGVLPDGGVLASGFTELDESFRLRFGPDLTVDTAWISTDGYPTDHLEVLPDGRVLTFGGNQVAISDGVAAPTRITLQDGAVLTDAAIDATGRIVLGGVLADRGALVVRLRSDGSLDPTFDDDGSNTVPLAGTGPASSAAVLSTDDAVLVGVVPVPGSDGPGVVTVRFGS